MIQKKTRSFSFLIIILLLIFAVAGCKNPDTSPHLSGTDTTAPSILTIDPVDGATDIDLDRWITIIFSEPMDIDNINDQTIQVLSGAVPAGTVLHLPEGDSIETLSIEYPNTGFQMDTTYTVVVSTTIHDLAGNTLVEEFTSSLTTKAELGRFNNNDYGYVGADSRTLTGTFDISSLSAELIFIFMDIKGFPEADRQLSEPGNLIIV